MTEPTRLRRREPRGARARRRARPRPRAPACAGTSPTSTPAPTTRASRPISTRAERPREALRRAPPRARRRALAGGARWPRHSTSSRLCRSPWPAPGAYARPALRRRHLRAAPRRAAPARAGARPAHPQRAAVLRARVGGARTTRAAEALLADPALARCRHLLGALRRYRPHLLSEPEERLLEETANTGRRAFAACSTRCWPTRASASSSTDERARARRGGGASPCCTSRTATAPRGGRRADRRAARALAARSAFVFNTLRRTRPCSGPPAPLRRSDGRAPSRQRDRRRRGAGADRRLRGALRRSCGATTDLKRGCSGSPTLYDYDRYAPLPEAGGARGFDGRPPRSCSRPTRDFAPPMREIAERFFAGAGSTPSCAPASAAAPSARRTVPSAHPYVLLNYIGEPARRDDAGARARPRRAPVPGAPARPLRAGHAADHGRDGERVRRDAGVRPPAARGARPGGAPGAAVREDRGRVRHRLPPGRADALRAAPARRAARRGRAASSG